MAAKTPKYPAHLRPETGRWWEQITAEFDLDVHHLAILQASCEAWDRGQQARERLAKDGPYVLDRFKVLKAHPAIQVERDSRVSFLRALRELGLDVDGPADESRPPIIRGSANLKAIG